MLLEKLLKYFLLPTVFLFGLNTVAQTVNATADTTAITFGEQILYTIAVEADSSATVVFPKKQTFLPFEMIEILPLDTIRKKAKQQLIQKYALTQWDSGFYTIPKQKVLINGKSYLTDSLRIAVARVEVDTVSKDFFDIKPLVEVEKTNFFKAKNILWIGLILILIAALLYWFVFRKKPLSETEKIALLPPYDRALLKLKNLEQSRYIINSEHKKYYSELTDIVRNYLEEEAKVNALESTTSQLIEKLKKLAASEKLPLKSETVINFKSVLETADLVKFAKAEPELKVAETDRQVVKRLVERTHQVLPEPTQEELLQSQEYLTKTAKKKRKKRIVITVIASLLLVSSVITGVILRYGWQNLKDSTLGHPIKELAEGEWVRSSYGYPPVSISTPKVLKRTPIPLPDTLSAAQQAALKDLSIFTYGSLTDNFYIALSAYSVSDEQKVNLEAASEISVKIIEDAGAIDMVVKREKFTAFKGEQGLRTYGRLRIKNPITKNEIESDYSIYTFAEKGGLQQLVLLYPRDNRYATSIVNRIENSIRFK